MFGGGVFPDEAIIISPYSPIVPVVTSPARA
jgi:hypothetical protein